MADITMCLAEKCKKKDKCYRCTAVPNCHQSWSDLTNFCNEDNNYKFFIEDWRTIVDACRK